MKFLEKFLDKFTEEPLEEFLEEPLELCFWEDHCRITKVIPKVILE